MAADPFEEFEFKPLTDGLGFHRKKTTPAPQLGLELDLLSDMDQDIESPSPLSQTLPRPHRRIKIDETPVPTTDDAVNEILKTLKQKQVDTVPTPKLTKTPPVTQWKEVLPSFSAGFLDFMLILASTLLCLIIVLAVTKVDLIGNWLNPDKEKWVYISTLALFMAVSFIYLSVNRVFLGCTPGEWAHDSRIGKPEEQNTAIYTLRVILRSFLSVISGFILFPIMSLFMKTDVVGEMSRTQIFKKV